MKNYTDKRTQKETIDADLALIEQGDFEFNKPKDESVELMKASTESYSRDMALTDPVADFASTPQSKNEIDHRPEAKIYSKSHEIDESEYRANKGNKTK